jgi:hypothetical protein
LLSVQSATTLKIFKKLRNSFLLIKFSLSQFSIN